MVVRTLLFTCLIAVFGSVAQAQESSVSVPVRPLRSEAAVADMHDDVRAAARSVCGGRTTARLELSERRLIRRCMANAMDRAIAQSSIVALQQYHAGTRGEALLAFLEPQSPVVAAIADTTVRP
jgi:UrcA family protein